MKNDFNRRDVIKVGGVVFMSGAASALAAFVTGCGTGSASSSSTTSGTSTNTGNSATTGSSSCSLATNVTRGPYFIDDRTDANISGDVVDTNIPQRSDIRSDSEGSSGTQAGLPLALTINVNSYSGGTCSSIANAQVHIWHCNAQGIYSDVQAGSNGNCANYV